jgi:hypothetical protein
VMDISINARMMLALLLMQIWCRWSGHLLFKLPTFVSWYRFVLCFQMCFCLRAWWYNRSWICVLWQGRGRALGKPLVAVLHHRHSGHASAEALATAAIDTGIPPEIGRLIGQRC